ncbi:MAG: HDOD domain-containing protein [Nitrospinota bacterium]
MAEFKSFANKEDLLRMLDKIPQFSVTVAKVIKLSGDPNASPKQIIHAISLDPELTARVLKLINSSYFGVTSKIVSLQRAVVMLGMNTIKNVAISSSVLSKIKLRGNFKWYTNSEFWEHCLACAVASKMIAAKIGISMQQREEFFIAGLLHDIGKVIFLQYLTEDFSVIEDPDFAPGEKKSDIELREFGVDHAELGSIMAERWKLPERLSEAIHQHHNPVMDGGEMDQVKAAVHLADVACNRMGIGIKKALDLNAVSDGTWSALSIKPCEPEVFLEGIEQKVDEAKVFLSS